MNHRWEFIVVLSGWGKTPQEAWDQTQEAIAENGLGDCPDELNPLNKHQLKEAQTKHRDYALRQEPDLHDCPVGTLAVWNLP